MEPPDVLSAPSTTTNLTAQDGVDMLWRYQLRKESAALLERLEASKKMIEDVTSETTRKLKDTAERISTLESKLASIGKEGQKLREAKGKWDDDIAALKDQMGIITETVIPETQPISEPSLLLQPTVSDAPALVIDTNRSFTTSPVSTQAAPIETTALPALSDASLLATGALPSNIIPEAESQSPAVLSAGPQTRSRNKSKGLAPILNTPVETTRPNPARIYQGTNSLATYYKETCTALSSTAKDRNSEIAFIEQFIKGIREPKKRSALANELQKVHPCRTDKNGEVEILCEWADVAEGLNKLGYLDVQPPQAPLQSQGGKRKKKMLISRDMLASGMMR